MRVDLTSWQEVDGRVTATLRSTRPIDPRVTRYFDRSSSFEDTRVENTAADGLGMTVSTMVAKRYFPFARQYRARLLTARSSPPGVARHRPARRAHRRADRVIYGATAGYLAARSTT